MYSIYDLGRAYRNTFYKGNKLNREDRLAIHKELKKIIKRGWSSEEILSIFKLEKRNRGDYQTLSLSKFFTAKKPKKRNLLDPSKFYYHNQLRLTCKPPKRSMDYDSGEIVILNEPYFLEMKASYTVEDLLQYWGKQVGQKIRAEEIRRLSGSMEWLLRGYDIEQVLFMIDETVNMARAEDLPLPHTPLDIQKYRNEALNAYNAKKTESVLAGGNMIVRKKRVPRN